MIDAGGTRDVRQPEDRRRETIACPASTDFAAATTPRMLWVELTSKCPFDCIFCSRELRRGKGSHLPFAVYSSLLEGLSDPRKLLLNCSGESTVYPDLIPAIERARATGASVELVSALASVPESLLGPLSQSGLGRLTVSIHAVSAEKFAEIYRHGSFDTLRARLERFLELCRADPWAEPAAPLVDLAFVAMDTNLTELRQVAALASDLALGEITIFPVMRRDQIPAQFPTELEVDGKRRPEFQERLRAAVRAAEESHAGIRFTLSNETLDAPAGGLGEVPIPYPATLPEGALIHSCEQNPWETAHVLSNGDVVACEALDRIPLGNLVEQPIGEIWHGPAYESFRARYRRGEVAECRACPWKRAYLPRARASEIVAARGLHAQLLYGWHEPHGENHIWSSQRAALVLEPRAGSRTLHLSGMLPPGEPTCPNQLEIRVNGTAAGEVTNPSQETMLFGVDVAVEPDAGDPWQIELRTSGVYRPAERGAPRHSNLCAAW
jgi:MoaA/NifB/PqqE/SkfB family radical SAM enzyme